MKRFLTSSKFLYASILILFSLLIIRGIILGLYDLHPYDEMIVVKLFNRYIYILAYIISVFSLFYIRFKIDKAALFAWLSVVLVSFFHELGFVFQKGSVSLKFFSDYTALVSFGVLFFGLWDKFNGGSEFDLKVLRVFEIVVISNCSLVLISHALDLPIFKSYPDSVRWGYSGFLKRGYNVIFSTILLIDYLNSKGSWDKMKLLKTGLVVLSIIISGTKAGLLSLGMIFYFHYGDSMHKRILLALSGLIGIIFLPYWIKYLIKLSPFWSATYDQSGPWGVFFSLRNENLLEFFNLIKNEYSYINWLFGGKIYPERLWVEILPIDLFGFYGLVGFIAFINLFRSVSQNLKVLIPVFVSFGSGSFVNAPLAFIIWAIWAKRFEKS